MMEGKNYMERCDTRKEAYLRRLRERKRAHEKVKYEKGFVRHFLPLFLSFSVDSNERQIQMVLIGIGIIVRR